MESVRKALKTPDQDEKLAGSLTQAFGRFIDQFGVAKPVATPIPEQIAVLPVKPTCVEAVRHEAIADAQGPVSSKSAECSICVCSNRA